MAGIIKSSLCLLAITTVLLAVVGPQVEAVLSCGTVVSSLGQCLPYVRGVGPLGGCCGGVRSLNAAARTTADRQAACNCIKSLSGSLPGNTASRAASLPRVCGVRIPYPITRSVDCSRIR